MQLLNILFLVSMTSILFIQHPVDANVFRKASRAHQFLTNSRTVLSNGRHSHKNNAVPTIVPAEKKPGRLARVADITSQGAVALTGLGTLFATITSFGSSTTTVTEEVTTFFL